MVAFKLRIDKVFKAFSCNCVIVPLYPKTEICTFYSIFPNPIWPTSQPLHAFNPLFWKGKGNPKNIDIRLKKCSAKTATSSCIFKCNHMHFQSPIGIHTPFDMINTTIIIHGADGRIALQRNVYFINCSFSPIIYTAWINGDGTDVVTNIFNLSILFVNLLLVVGRL